MAKSAQPSLVISQAVLEKWEAWYARHIGQAATDTQELELIQEYRRRAEAGFTLTEDGEEARVGRPRWTVATAQALADEAQPQAAVTARRRLIVLAALAALVLVLCVVLGTLLTPVLAPRGRGAAAAGRGGATEGPLPTAAPVLVEVDGRKLALDAPRSIELRGAVLQVVPGEVTAGGALKYPAMDAAGQAGQRMVVWFPSPANWLIGADARVTQALAVGDIIVGRTATGRVLRFVVDDVRAVRPQEVEALAQGRAGLVLFPLLSEGETARIVSARYDPASEQPLQSAGAPGVSAGEPIVLTGGGTLSVATVDVARRRDGFYQVTVGIVMTGAGILPPALLSVDGQRYPQLQGQGLGADTLAFYVSALGTAELVLGEQRVGLGTLAPPQLVGELADVHLTDAGLTVAVTITAAAGSGYLVPGDVVLLSGSGDASGAAGSAPVAAALEMTPAEVYVRPGAPVRAEFTFAPPRGVTSVRLSVLGTVWEITGINAER